MSDRERIARILAEEDGWGEKNVAWDGGPCLSWDDMPEDARNAYLRTADRIQATPAGTEPDTLLKKLEAEIETWQSPYEGEDETSIVQWSDVLAVFATPAEEPTLPILHERDESGNWICCCGDHLVTEEPSADVIKELLFWAWKYDDKPWKLYARMIDLAEAYPSDYTDEIVRLMNERIDSMGRPTPTEDDALADRLDTFADESWPYAQVLSNMNRPKSDNNVGRAVVLMREAATRLRQRKTPDGWIGNGVYLTEHDGTMKLWAKDGMSMRPFVYIGPTEGGGS